MPIVAANAAPLLLPPVRLRGVFMSPYDGYYETPTRSVASTSRLQDRIEQLEEEIRLLKDPDGKIAEAEEQRRLERMAVAKPVIPTASDLIERQIAAAQAEEEKWLARNGVPSEADVFLKRTILYAKDVDTQRRIAALAVGIAGKGLDETPCNRQTVAHWETIPAAAREAVAELAHRLHDLVQRSSWRF